MERFHNLISAHCLLSDDPVTVDYCTLVLNQYDFILFRAIGSFSSWDLRNETFELQYPSSMLWPRPSIWMIRKLVQAPVPLSIFRSNSKFDENSERSSFEYTRPITTIFCTRHDSDTVVTWAKYRCDRPRIFYTRVFWIFIEFRFRSKYA